MAQLRQGGAVLEAAGLTAAEESIYLALLHGGAANVAQLTETTGQSEARISRAVGGLHRLGLVQRTPPPHDLVVPVPPEVALDALIERRHDQLDRTREAVRAL